jgi:hypothetical protein
MKKSVSENILLTIPALVLYLIIIVKWGPGVTDDSINFLAAALSFPPHLEKIDGSPFVEWTPLFPVILSFFKYTGTDILLFASILHGIIFCLTTCIVFNLISERLTNSPVKIISKIIFLFSTPLLLVNIFLWSEPLFNLFLLLAIIFLHRYLQVNERSTFILLIISGALMCLQRKSGILFTIPVAICLFTLAKHGKTSKKLLKSFLYLIFSSAPFIWYLVTRKSVSGKYFTHYEFDPGQLQPVSTETFNVLSTWLFPDELSLTIRLSVSLSLLVLFVIVSTITIRFTRIKLRIFESLLLTIFIFYILAVIVGFMFVRLDQAFDDRIFASVYIPGMLLFCCLLDSIYKKIPLLPMQYAGNIRRFYLIMLALWLLYPVSRTIFNTYTWYTRGPGGYNQIKWHQNPVISFLSETENQDLTVCTDNKFPLFYFLSVQQKKKLIFAEVTPASDCLIADFGTIGNLENVTPVLKSAEGNIYIRGNIPFRKR